MFRTLLQTLKMSHQIWSAYLGCGCRCLTRLKAQGSCTLLGHAAAPVAILVLHQLFSPGHHQPLCFLPGLLGLLKPSLPAQRCCLAGLLCCDRTGAQALAYMPTQACQNMAKLPRSLNLHCTQARPDLEHARLQLTSCCLKQCY